MENKVSEILGFAVKKVEADKVDNLNNLELVEASGQYNKDETISVETLSDYETYYVMIIKNGDWEFEGYYQEV